MPLSPKVFVSFNLPSKSYRKHLWLPAGSYNSFASHQSVVRTLHNCRPIRILKGSHAGMEWNPQEAADFHQFVSGSAYQVLILKYVNRNSALHKAVSFYSQPVGAQQGSVRQAFLFETRGVFARPYDTAAYICGIPPDYHKPGIREENRQPNQRVVLVRRLATPNRSIFLLRILLISDLGSSPYVRNIRGYSAGIDLMALYGAVPEIPSLLPLRLASPSQEKRPQPWQITLIKQRDLRMLVE
ncbi:MAG: hypothetical protein WBQ85_20295 [Candidatus Sulfotelmatobacter sp.]